MHSLVEVLAREKAKDVQLPVDVDSAEFLPSLLGDLAVRLELQLLRRAANLKFSTSDFHTSMF